MSQQIIIDFPPMYEEIQAAFHVKPSDSVIFSWGERIFNPGGVYIQPALMAHEAVHGERQGNGQQILDWWKRYIEDRQFRLQEELPAHVAEYRYITRNSNRKARRAALKATAARLANPLYGRIITPPAAMVALRNYHG